MKPNQQNTNQQNSQQNTNQQNNQPMNGPRAASKRDVEEAEAKAAEAQKMAAEETEKIRQEVRQLKEKNQQLREDKEALTELVEQCVAAIRHIDQHLDQVDDVQGKITKQYRSEDIADMAGLPQYDELENVELVDPADQEE